MSLRTMTSSVLALALATAGAATAQTVTPEMRLQDSQSFAIGNQVRAFRVPTRDSAGVIRFYDVTVTLGVASTGAVNPGATVTSTPSPSIATGVIQPGNYRSSDSNTTCTVRNVTLTNGRIQSFIACIHTTAGRFELSVATGPVAAGHPYLPQLQTSAIPSRPDVATATWGLVTTGNFRANACDGQTNDTGNIVAVKTNGSQLFIDLFEAFSGSASLYCGSTLFKF